MCATEKKRCAANIAMRWLVKPASSDGAGAAGLARTVSYWGSPPPAGAESSAGIVPRGSQVRRPQRVRYSSEHQMFFAFVSPTQESQVLENHNFSFLDVWTFSSRATDPPAAAHTNHAAVALRRQTTSSSPGVGLPPGDRPAHV